MNHITLTSREFNQDTGRAKKATNDGPVFVTDRGRTTHVLLSIEAYQALSGNTPSIIDLLAMNDGAEIEFEPPRVQGFTKPLELA